MRFAPVPELILAFAAAERLGVLHLFEMLIAQRSCACYLRSYFGFFVLEIMFLVVIHSFLPFALETFARVFASFPCIVVFISGARIFVFYLGKMRSFCIFVNPAHRIQSLC